MSRGVSMGDPGKPFLHPPVEQIPPNKFSGAYLISLLLSIPRFELRPESFTQFQVTKIYRRGLYSYIVPQLNEQPPEGYRWIHMGRKHGRDIYRAI